MEKLAVVTQDDEEKTASYKGRVEYAGKVKRCADTGSTEPFEAPPVAPKKKRDDAEA